MYKRQVVLDALLYAGGRRGWKMAGCMVLSFAALYGALSFAALHSPWLPAYDREKAIPWQHWVMMGLSGDGGYNDADYKLTLAGEDDKMCIRDSAGGAHPHGRGPLRFVL